MLTRSQRFFMISGLGLALIGLIAVANTAQAAEGQMITFENTMGDETKGYLAVPEGVDEAPAILVIHEWWGLTDWVKQNADRFADRGYVALAVDLYNGQATDDPGKAHELSRALDQGEAIADMNGAIAVLNDHEQVNQDKKIGVIGWCMGGGYSRLISQESEEIGPTVICYGSITTEPKQIQTLSNKPILGIFGAEDRGIPAAKVRQFADALKDAGTPIEVHIYDGAGHAFMRPGGRSYVQEPANDAWKQIDDFFAKHLQP